MGMEKNIRFYLILILVNLGIFIGLMVITEGIASFIFLALEFLDDQKVVVAERLHTKYDPDLGWINIPGIYLPNLYGAGKSVRINTQSFRGAVDYSHDVPRDKVRIICTGDSFAFGFGVGDESTWSHLLSDIDNSIETINMGQGGYGIDQSYLWYMRDGRAFAHDILLFTFTHNDFWRAQREEIMGYGKPLLRMQGEEMRVTNVPVPRGPYAFSWVKSYLHAMEQSRLVGAIHMKASQHKIVMDDVEKVIVFRKIFETLTGDCLGKGRMAVLVYLPTLQDLESGAHEELRYWLLSLAREKGWNYIDLTPDFARMELSKAVRLFIPVDAIPGFLHAGGHYTEEGNVYVASLLYRYLLTTKGLSDRFGASRSRADAGR